jgi:hypothetical protein
LNSDKQNPFAIRGNALIYVLLAIALLGALTMLLANQDSQSDDLTAEIAELQTTKVTAYAATAKQTVEQMMMTGTTMDTIDFDRPQDADFDTGPFIHKIYHPDGGGLNYFAATAPPFDGKPDPNGNGWYFNFVDVEWTPTPALDLVFTAYMIDRQICENINYKITGSRDIPILASNSLQLEFLPISITGDAANLPLDTTICSECEGFPSMCVSNGFGSDPSYGYYNIIVAR